ncbi:hypothetical protein AB8Z38_16270 [Bradyrhizobium sp. LLZ17]|uniref:DUF3072 domain-containing protein n=1 Tax=Bradyrhizobium sp. LLZ17 TaxID=3239388 RepID=A0AB39XUA1_9BRAD
MAAESRQDEYASRDRGTFVDAAGCEQSSGGRHMSEKPTPEQLEQLKRLSREARVPDESEIVTSKQEAEQRIRDLKAKRWME